MKTYFKLLVHKGLQAGAGEIATYSSLESAEQHRRLLIEQEGYSEAEIRIFPYEVEGAVAVGGE